MGLGYVYRCKNCKNEIEIMYGVGFLGFKEFYTENNYTELIEIARREKMTNFSNLLDFIKNKDVDLKEGYGYDAYICPSCRNLDNKFRFMLYTHNKRFIPKYKCMYCNDILRVKKGNEDFVLTCDKCGSNDFEHDDMDFMCWD